MGPQAAFDPMLFLALTPTIIFIGLAIAFVRGRQITQSFYQRWVREHNQKRAGK